MVSIATDSVYLNSLAMNGYCPTVKKILNDTHDIAAQFASVQEDAQPQERGGFLSNFSFNYVNIDNSSRWFSPTVVNNSSNNEKDNSRAIIAIAGAIGLGIVGFVLGKEFKEYEKASNLLSQCQAAKISFDQDFSGDGKNHISRVMTAALNMLETIKSERFIGLASKLVLFVGCGSAFIGALVASEGAVIVGAVLAVSGGVFMLFRLGYNWSEDPVDAAVGQVFLKLKQAGERDLGNINYDKAPIGFKVPTISTAVFA